MSEGYELPSGCMRKNNTSFKKILPNSILWGTIVYQPFLRRLLSKCYGCESTL